MRGGGLQVAERELGHEGELLCP